MTPINEIPGCFKFYDERGRRLSAFLLEDEIVIFRCSKGDVFSKKAGREYLEEYLLEKNDPKAFEGIIRLYKINPIIIPAKGFTKQEFFSYMKNNYRRKYTEELHCHGDIVSLKYKGNNQLENSIIHVEYLTKENF